MTPRTTSHPSLRSGLFAALAGVAVLAACEAKLPTSAEVEKLDVASAEKQQVTQAMMGKKMEFEVDGKKVTAAEAHALASSRIGSVEIVHAKSKDGTAVMKLRTTKSDSGQSLEISGPRMRMSSNDVSFHSDSSGLHKVAVTMHGVIPAGAEPRARTFAGLIMIDGVVSDQKAMNALDPNRIESVEVLKAAMATAESSDPRAANGIIKIVTKK